MNTRNDRIPEGGATEKAVYRGGTVMGLNY